MKLKAIDVANYFILLSDGDDITNLKAQKLVYFAYGHYMAKHNKPLFIETIEAWEHGPVVHDLYASFKQYKARPILLENSFDSNIFSEEIRGFLQDIYLKYGEYKATELCDLSHAKHSPWHAVYYDGTRNDVINDTLIRIYFTELDLVMSQKPINKIKAAKILAQDKSLAETMYIFSHPINAKKLNDALNSPPEDAIEIDWEND